MFLPDTAARASSLGYIWRAGTGEPRNPELEGSLGYRTRQVSKHNPFDAVPSQVACDGRETGKVHRALSI